MNTRESDLWQDSAAADLSTEALQALIARTCDIVLLLEKGGMITALQTAPNAGALRAATSWVGRNIRDIVTADTIAGLDAGLRALSRGHPDNSDVLINVAEPGIGTAAVRITLHHGALPDQTLIIGRDVSDESKLKSDFERMEAAYDGAQAAQRDFQTRYRVIMESAADPFAVIVAETLRIVDINPAACRLLGTTADVSVGNLLTQECTLMNEDSAGPTSALMELASASDDRSIQVRAIRGNRDLNVKARQFRSGNARLMLLCFASNATDQMPTMTAPAVPSAPVLVGNNVSEDALQHVLDQVGTSSIKDIVAATADVIERACIDAALDKTRNNRAAAAEMLGLSRQSLYVKLRKFGILQRDS